jgi:positive phototaxis protein PixI
MAQQVTSFQVTSVESQPESYHNNSRWAKGRSQDGERQFLTFPLGGNTSAMLPVSQLAEVLTVPYIEIMPIPDLPVWVLGVNNWRGEMLWVIDLASLAGLPPLSQQQTGFSNCKVVISKVQVDGQPVYLGSAVQDVEEMYWCPVNAIVSPPAAVITPGLAPFLAGYTLGSAGQMLMALDAAAITERVGLLTN